MPAEIEVARPATPMDLLQLAIEKADKIDPTVALTVIKELKALQNQERDYQAKVGFEKALSRVQDQVSWVATDMANSSKGNRYASFEALDRALRPHYVKEGFSLSFDADPHPPAGQQIIVALLSREGHTRQYHLPLTIDGNGPKGNPVMNATQAGIAAFSYGCRVLLRRIFNVGTGEEDQDGNTTPAEVDNMPEQRLKDILESIATATSKKEVFRIWANATEECTKRGDIQAQRELLKAKDHRTEEIDNENRL